MLLAQALRRLGLFFFDLDLLLKILPKDKK